MFYKVLAEAQQIVDVRCVVVNRLRYEQTALQAPLVLAESENQGSPL
jgi:hypothetical protein